MKKLLLLLLLCLPMFGFGQNKKMLRQQIENKNDSLIILNNAINKLELKINSLEEGTVLLNSKLSSTKLETENILTEKMLLNNKIEILKNNIETLSKENNSISYNLDSLSILNKSLESKLITKSDSIESLYSDSKASSTKRKGIIPYSSFSKNNINGVWEINSLALQSGGEYVSFDNVSSDEDKASHNYKEGYNLMSSIISKITFMKPNIAILELEDGSSLSCLYEIMIDDGGSNQKIKKTSTNFLIQFVDMDRDKLVLTISEFNKTVIFQYDFYKLLSFFNRTKRFYRSSFKVAGNISTGGYDTMGELYNLTVIGVFK